MTTTPILLSFAILTSVALTAYTHASPFTNVTTTVTQDMPGVNYSSVAWADFDNDGNLDFLLTGQNAAGIDVSQLWRNTGSGFTNITANVLPDLPGVSESAVAWSDFDNDGRLDFLLFGSTNLNGPYVGQLWQNTGNGFSNVTEHIAPNLPGLRYGAAAWGDYDNDGRPDLLIAGRIAGTDKVSQLWRNTVSGFSNVTASVTSGLTGVEFGSVAWGDYDNDGRLDFLLTGTIQVRGAKLSQIWRNTEHGFTNVTDDVAPTLPNVGFSSVAWGDYDNDGHLDFLLSGDAGIADAAVHIWRNTGNGFTNVSESIAPGLPEIYLGSAAWGDYDNDGWLDFLVTGFDFDSGGYTFSQLWRNTGSGFLNEPVDGLPGVYASSVPWGDYDNDGRLDFLLTGLTNSVSAPAPSIAQLWRNDLAATNSAPTAPTAPTSSFSNGLIHLTWDPATDAQTSSTGLSYNLRVGTTPGAVDVMSPWSFTNGMRLLPALGNAQMRTNALLKLLPGTYYWSVQAIDTTFVGGPFTTETSFTVPGPQLSITTSNSDVVIAWPPDHPDFLLQETHDLNAMAWTNSPSLNSNPVVVPATGTGRYYRLIHSPPM